MDFIFDPSLVLYLPLYELDGASFMSKDACGYTCTVTGALWRPNGRYFDGIDDHIDCGNDASLKGTGALTLDVWVKPVYGINGNILGDYYNGNRAQHRWMITALNRNRFDTNDGTANALVGSLILVDGAWNHVAIVRMSIDGAIYSYVNNVRELLGTSSNVPPDNEVDNTEVGANGMEGEHFKGDIGELRLYKRALTPLEIQHNYLATMWRYR